MDCLRIFLASFILPYVCTQDPYRPHSPDKRFVCSARHCMYYFCTNEIGTNNWLLDVFVRKNSGDMTGMFAIDVTTGSSMTFSCDNTPVILAPVPFNPTQEVTGDGTDADPYTVRIAINSLTRIASPGCGTKITDPSTVEASFQPVAGQPASWEVQHALTCDFSNTTTTQTDSVLAIATITQATVPVTYLGDPLVLQVLNAQGQSVSTITGTQIILQAEFLSGPDIHTPVANATGISPHSCKLCDAKDCSGSLVTALTDTNGCPIGSHFVAGGLAGDGVRLTSSLLSLNSISGYSFIYFVCSEDYCTVDTGLAKCQDRCTTLGRRKKRDLDLHMDLFGKSRQYRSSKILYQRLDTERLGDCSRWTGVSIVISLLSTTLGITVIISLIQCIRLFCLIRRVGIIRLSPPGAKCGKCRHISNWDVTEDLRKYAEELRPMYDTKVAAKFFDKPKNCLSDRELRRLKEMQEEWSQITGGTMKTFRNPWRTKIPP